MTSTTPSTPKTPLSPRDEPPDIPDLGDRSESEPSYSDPMTASYSEICFDGDGADDDILPSEISDLQEVQEAAQGLKAMVEDLCRDNEDDFLPKSLQPVSESCLPQSPDEVSTSAMAMDVSDGYMSRNAAVSSVSNGAGDSFNSEFPHEVESSVKSLESPAHSVGSLSDKFVTYVAEDLEEKIRLSSPSPPPVLPQPLKHFQKLRHASVTASSSEAPSSPESRVSMTSSRGLRPLDATALLDMEEQARKVACSLDALMAKLSGSFESITSLTLDSMEIMESGVNRTSDTIDANIKSMYQMMAKYEELNNSMKPIYDLQRQVNGIKKYLDILEAKFAEPSKKS